ncbi:MAG: acetylornithine deacetylase [Pseudomonadota bacterium]|nr:acetylornithine deacetylase [Pseudomonadota bacterium]
MSAAPHPLRERGIAILADLVGFPSVSLRPNGDIVGHIEAYLAGHGIACRRDAHEDGDRFNLLACIGPQAEGGVLLSGHLDVVPADAAGWTQDPFRLRRADGRLHGRGAVDMKGFLAMVLAMAPEFQARAGALREPLYLAFTFDEEIGCFGAERMPAFLARAGATPRIAIVGEPTGMTPINGHKGGMELVTHVRGAAGHASKPGQGVNAISVAARIIGFINETAAACAARPAAGSPFDPPFTTLSVGTIQGGEARNIIPDTCRFDWEIRAHPGDDPHRVLDQVTRFIADEVVPSMRKEHPACEVVTEMMSDVPPLATRDGSAAAALIARLWTNQPPSVVSFGTDGAYFQQAGLDVIVIGPGGMAQMHQPDEFITEEAMDEGLLFLGRLCDEMCGQG